MATRDDLVDIAVDEQRIAGTLITPGTLIPGVLFVHGWGGSQRQYVERARAVAALGCICLTFDLRGHEKTGSQYATVTREHNLRDVLAAYDTLLRQRDVDASAIAVVGSSYGGYLAAILTSLRKVRWLALRAPALYRDADWALPKGQLRERQELEKFRRQAVQPEESRALHACTAFRGAALLVESENDAIVPAQVHANYRTALSKAASLTCRTLDGADHALSQETWQQAYTEVLVHWLREMVQGARSEATAQPVMAAPQARNASIPAIEPAAPTA